MHYILLIIFLILVGYLIYTTIIFLGPTKCTKCKEVILKKYIKRIGIAPYCPRCYNDIEKRNKEG